MSNQIGKGLKFLFTLVVLILIGLAFFIEIGHGVKEQTSDLIETNETIDLSVARLASSNVNESWEVLIDNPDLSSTTIVMANGTDGLVITTGNYTVNLTSTGNYTIYLINTSYWAVDYIVNTSVITYSFYNENYVEFSNARAMLNILLIISAVFLFGAVVAWIMKNKGFEFGV